MAFSKAFLLLGCVIGACLLQVQAKAVKPLAVDIGGMPCYTNEDCLSSEVCQRSENARQGNCAFSAEPTDADLQKEMGATALAGAGLDVKSLTMVPTKGQAAMITFGSSNPNFHLGVGKNGTLRFLHGKKNMMTIGECNYDAGGCKIKAYGTFNAKNDLKMNGPLIYGAGSQWFVGAAETFDAKHEGLHTGPPTKAPWVWKGEKGTQMGYTTCGGTKKMLGGYGMFAGGEVTRTIKGLKAKHKELRVKANFHFIDSWESETAYLKVDGDFMWSDIYDYQVARTGVNICGSVAAEGKYTSHIDVVIPHNTSTVTLTFGSTLDQSPFDESWGVDDIEILVR